MQGRECLHCHYLAILQTLSGFSGYRRCRWLRHFTASGQWSERFTDYCEPTLVVGGVAVEMVVDDMLDKVADAVSGSTEESGDTLDTVKRVVADCHLMLVVLAELNQTEVCLAVIFEVALALLGGGAGWLGLSVFALSGDWLDIGVDGIFHSFGKI